MMFDVCGRYMPDLGMEAVVAKVTALPRTSHVTRNRGTRHASHVRCYTSHVTLLSSHVTLLSSHVTRHTSPTSPLTLLFQGDFNVAVTSVKASAVELNAVQVCACVMRDV